MLPSDPLGGTRALQVWGDGEIKCGQPVWKDLGTFSPLLRVILFFCLFDILFWCHIQLTSGSVLRASLLLGLRKSYGFLEMESGSVHSKPVAYCCIVALALEGFLAGPALVFLNLHGVLTPDPLTWVCIMAGSLYTGFPSIREK